MIVELVGVLNAARFGAEERSSEICFYRCGLNAEVVQVQDPAAQATIESVCFVKYDIDKGRLFFYSTALRKCRPGHFGGACSPDRFLARAITRYDLLPINMF